MKEEKNKEETKTTEKPISKEEKLIQEKDNKINELTETIQRLQADFENYKKRVQVENLQLKTYCTKDIILKLLPILDTFELAFKNTDNKEEFEKGIEMIFAGFYQSLEDLGLKKIETESCKFDPFKHEVLLTHESEKEEGTILEEIQKGYILDDKVIRHSKVKIAKKKEGDKCGKGAADNEHKHKNT